MWTPCDNTVLAAHNWLFEMFKTHLIVGSHHAQRSCRILLCSEHGYGTLSTGQRIGAFARARISVAGWSSSEKLRRRARRKPEGKSRTLATIHARTRRAAAALERSECEESSLEICGDQRGPRVDHRTRIHRTKVTVVSLFDFDSFDC